MRNDKLKLLELKIKHLDEYMTTTMNSDLDELRRELKTEYDFIMKERTEGAIIRSKIKWWEDGERSTAYFLNLEKQRQSHNKIHKLVTLQGKTVDKDKDILECAVQFYET